MDLLEDLMSLLNYDFVVIYIIHEILVLIENHLNYLKDNIFECFLRKKYFFHNIMLKNARPEEEKVLLKI